MNPNLIATIFLIWFCIGVFSGFIYLNSSKDVDLLVALSIVLFLPLWIVAIIIRALIVTIKGGINLIRGK